MTTEESEKLDLPPMNNNLKIMVEQVIKQQEIYDNLVKMKGLDDLFIFNRYVLEVEKGKMELGEFHRKLCHFVTDNKLKKKLILIPRGHLKSTLITIGYSVFRILQNPNIRILIRNATWQMAVDFLAEIKKHLTTNETILRLYGDVTQGKIEWSQDRITLARTDTNIKGPTVWATGIESNLVGAHPDLIIDDDLVNRENVSTQEQIEKVILRYKDTVDLLEPGGQYLIIGTRWSESDLYSWILDSENNVRQHYEVMIKQAYQGDLVSGEGFVPLWPSKFSQDELKKRLNEKGWYEFSSQYLNNPVPDEAADFKREWFQYYDIEDIRGKEMTKAILVDPAISTAKEADFTAMVVEGLDVWGNFFDLDLDQGHYSPNQVINKIFDLYEMWHPNFIGIEMVAYQKALAYMIREEMNRRGRFLPIYELKANDRTKDQRIRGLQPLYENKKMFHRKILRWNPYLENQLRSFPRGRHDDLLDAKAYALDLLTPPKKKTTRFEHHYLYGQSAL